MRNFFERGKGGKDDFTKSVNAQQAGLTALGRAAERAANGELALTMVQKIGRTLMAPGNIIIETMREGKQAAAELAFIEAHQKIEQGLPVTVDEIVMLADAGVAVPFNPLRPTN